MSPVCGGFLGSKPKQSENRDEDVADEAKPEKKLRSRGWEAEFENERFARISASLLLQRPPKRGKRAVPAKSLSPSSLSASSSSPRPPTFLIRNLTMCMKQRHAWLLSACKVQNLHEAASTLTILVSGGGMHVSDSRSATTLQ